MTALAELEKLRDLRERHLSCEIGYLEFFEELDKALRITPLCQHGVPLEDVCPRCGA